MAGRPGRAGVTELADDGLDAECSEDGKLGTSFLAEEPLPV
jgi:hypothetical protein